MKANDNHPEFDSAVMKVGRRGPDRLLTTFSKTPFLLWLSASLFVHAGLAGFVSYGYIRDHYLDPEGAVARKAAAIAAAATPAKPAAAAPKTAATPTNAPAVKPPVATATGTDTTARLLEEHKQTPIVKQITESAKPSEIPKQPGDLNISLDDTNPK